MDGRDFATVFDSFIRDLFLFGLTAGLLIGGAVFWLVPWLWKHISIAWN